MLLAELLVRSFFRRTSAIFGMFTCKGFQFFHCSSWVPSLSALTWAVGCTLVCLPTAFHLWLQTSSLCLVSTGFSRLCLLCIHFVNSFNHKDLSRYNENNTAITDLVRRYHLISAVLSVLNGLISLNFSYFLLCEVSLPLYIIFQT